MIDLPTVPRQPTASQLKVAITRDWHAYGVALRALTEDLAVKASITGTQIASINAALDRIEARLIAGPPAEQPQSPPSPPALDRFVSIHEMCVLPPDGGDTALERMTAYLRQYADVGIDAIALFDAEAEGHANRARQTYLDAGHAVGLGVFLEPGHYTLGVSRAVAQHPAYFCWLGRGIVSSYFGQQSQLDLARDLAAFLDEPFLAQLDVGDGNYVSALAQFPEVESWGMFKIVPSITEQAQLTRDFITACHAAGKSARAQVVATYRGLAHKGNWMNFEAWGYLRLRECWLAAIEAGADAVQLLTANDISEASHFGRWSDEPAFSAHWAAGDNPAILDHSGFLEFSRRYITWFKTGGEPAITEDELYYAYRLHPRTCANFVDLPLDMPARLLEDWGVAGQDAARIYTNDGADTSTLSDGIHVALRLTEPAQLFINGENFGEFPAGEHLVTRPGAIADGPDTGLGFPIHTFGESDFGCPRFDLRRAGRPIIEHLGELPITPYIMPGCRAIFARKAPSLAA